MGNYILLTSINNPNATAFGMADDFSTVYVGAGVTIAGLEGLRMFTTNVAVTVAGHVFGELAGVFWGSNPGALAGTAQVLAGASITAQGTAMFVQGQASVINYGTIASVGGTVVGQAISTSISSAGTFVLENHGTISYSPPSGQKYGTAFRGGAETDTIVNSGFMLGSVLTGGGIDEYDGRGGTIRGVVDLGGDNDTGIGGNGAETFLGSAGHDEFDGGGGTDTYDGSNGTARQTADLGAGSVISDDLGSDNIVSIENLFGGSNHDRLTGDDLTNVLRGNDGNDRLTGLGGHDRIFGGLGNDVILGGDGNDRLSGDDSVDSLNGGTGNDHLYGGYDIDTMTGGSGSDVFIFKDIEETFVITGRGLDRITDFVQGQDKIDVSVMDGNTFNAAGDQAFVFVGSAALTSAGQIGYHFVGGNTLVRMNPNFPGAGLDVFVLTGQIALTAADFLL
jgi:Ca2+-binding RTX toxin-like protein